MFNFPSMLLQRRPYSEVERRARLGFMEDPYDPEAVLPGSNNPNMNASGLLDSFNPNPFADMAPGGASRGSFPALESLPPRSLWGGERSSFGGESPEYMNKRNPELYDLMAGSLLGADPQQGMSPWLQNALDKSKPFTPSSIAPSDTVIPPMRTGGLLESLKSARQDLPLPNGVSYRDAMGMAIPAVGDVAAPDVNPLLEGMRAPGRAITFTTPGGMETARYNADNSFAGGDYRGQAYNTLNDRQAAMDAFSKLQGARETGIAGMPSIEGIMQNQLGPLPMSPEQKRMLALGVQDKFTNPLAGIVQQRMQSQGLVDAAEARRREVMSSKAQEILAYEVQRYIERNPNASEDEIAAFRNKVAAHNAIELPAAFRNGPAAPAVSSNPLDNAAYSNAAQRIQTLFTPDKGGTLMPNKDLARSIADILGDTKDEHRDKLAQQAALAAAGNPGLIDDLVRQAASDWSVTGMPVQQFDWTHFPSAPPRLGHPSLPLELVQDRPTNSWGNIGRGIRSATGDAQAAYSHALLPGNRRVALNASDLSRGPLGGVSEEDVRRAKSRQAGLNPLLRAMLAKDISAFEASRGK